MNNPCTNRAGDQHADRMRQRAGHAGDGLRPRRRPRRWGGTGKRSASTPNGRFASGDAEHDRGDRERGDAGRNAEFSAQDRQHRLGDVTVRNVAATSANTTACTPRSSLESLTRARKLSRTGPSLRVIAADHLAGLGRFTKQPRASIRIHFCRASSLGRPSEWPAMKPRGRAPGAAAPARSLPARP